MFQIRQSVLQKIKLAPFYIKHSLNPFEDTIKINPTIIITMSEKNASQLMSSVFINRIKPKTKRNVPDINEAQNQKSVKFILSILFP